MLAVSIHLFGPESSHIFPLPFPSVTAVFWLPWVPSFTSTSVLVKGKTFGNAFGHHISLLLKQMAPLNSSVVHEFLFTCLERPLGFPLPECCLRPSLCHHIQPPDSGVQQPRARLRSVSSPAGLEPSLSHVIGMKWMMPEKGISTRWHHLNTLCHPST